MARVPLIQEQDHPELAEVIEKYRSGRRGKLINMYRMLLVIIRMGHHTGAQYVLRQHVPSLAAAEGLTREECDALADWRPSKLFTERERAALAYADTMTRDITVPDVVFAEVKRHFNTREIVELTVLVGSDNMNARVVQALQLDLEPAAP